MSTLKRIPVWVVALVLGLGGGLAWAKISRQYAEAVLENTRIVVKGIASDYGELVTVCVDPTDPGRQWLWFRQDNGTLRRITLLVPKDCEEHVIYVERLPSGDTNTLVE